MTPKRATLFRTTTFRLALIYLALFSVSALALLAFVYVSTASITEQQTDQTIAAEITGLAEQYRQNGLAGLTAIVRERTRAQQLSLYILAAPDRTALAGNLNAWPNVETGPDGWLDFEYQRPVGGETRTHEARARHFILQGGFQLLVGRDVQERRDFARLIRISIAWSLALTLGLGVVGGLVMSRNLLRRVEAINRTGREIMAGELTRRVPVTGSGDEFDRLAENLNAMLDQIERLVTGMRQVTENIAHDLRGPLNRLRSRIEITLMEDATAGDYREALEQTIAEADQLISTFNALLSIARIEAGEASGSRENVDLAGLVRDAAELYTPVAEDRGQTLTVNAEGDTAVTGNRDLLFQAVTNLVDNAVKYAPDGGQISVTVERGAGGAPRISVADDGPGIPAAERERVRGRFVRLEESRSRPGAGLGLSLVAAVARLHGAELILGDNAPGLSAVLEFARP